MSSPTLDPPDGHGPPDGATPPSRELRRHPRVDLTVRCWIMNRRHTLYLRLHDLSRGGLSVRAPVPFAAASVIEVGMELPGGRRLRARGEVVWVRSGAADESGPRMGARFVEFIEGEAELYALLDASISAAS
jgi:PilZ domain-containing protein